MTDLKSKVPEGEMNEVTGVSIMVANHTKSISPESLLASRESSEQNSGRF